MCMQYIYIEMCVVSYVYAVYVYRDVCGLLCSNHYSLVQTILFIN